MKVNRKTAGVVIFFALVLLVFFSGTIYAYHKPRVTAAKPRRGGLSKLEITSGTAVRADREDVYAVIAGRAGRIFIREGAAVEKGTALFEMDFDTAAAERRRAETENNARRLAADIHGMEIRLGQLRAALASAAETAGGESVPVLSGFSGFAVLEINRAREAFRNMEFLYELGTASRHDVNEAENNLRSLLYRYEAEAEELEFSLAVKRLDMENAFLAREAAEETLRKYRENLIITTPVGGTVLVLNAERGKYMTENYLLVSIGSGDEFTVECIVSPENNFIVPGDIAGLANASRVLSGTVTRVKPAPEGKVVSVSVVSGEVTDGETFEVTFEKNSAASFTLVPSGAVHQDGAGYFVYRIKRRAGILGEEYCLERLPVFPGDSDHQNTAVIRGIAFFEPLVLAADKKLSEGVTVLLENAGDFFED